MDSDQPLNLIVYSLDHAHFTGGRGLAALTPSPWALVKLPAGRPSPLGRGVGGEGCYTYSLDHAHPARGRGLAALTPSLWAHVRLPAGRPLPWGDGSGVRGVTRTDSPRVLRHWASMPSHLGL